MASVICFGEIMMRLSPPGYARFVQSKSLDVAYGGSEANVSVLLAGFGIDVSFVTRLPENPLGQAALNELRKYGVNTQAILRGGDRMGIYFLEKGASHRASRVIYDREHSSMSTCQPGDFSWDDICKGANWLHISGITSAISASAAATVLDAVQQAKQRGLTISCDINYRSVLWSPEAAGKVLGELLEYTNLCIINEEHAALLFGIGAPKQALPVGTPEEEKFRCRRAAKELRDRFHLDKVAFTFRSGDSATRNHVGGMLYDGCDFYESRSYTAEIIDRVGAGDAFAGGLIYAGQMGYSPQQTIELAAATGCLKHTIEGDFCLISLQEALNLAQGKASGRIQR